MRHSGEPGGSATQRVLATAPFVVWAAIATVTVVLLFPRLHSYMDHALAIITSAVCGAAVGALGYGATSAFRSRRDVVLAGALGGGVGLLALHVLPLLH